MRSALAAALVLAVAVPLAIGQGGPTGPDGSPRMPKANEVLPGRASPMAMSEFHLLFGTPLDVHPAGTEIAYFGMGCFWGAEKDFFRLPGVVSTAVGYAGGTTPNPTYEEVSTGRTGHAEVVRVVYDPTKISYPQLLKVFWEGHDPTEGMRQGNDVGTNYRSLVLTTSEAQKRAALESKRVYAAALILARRGTVTTEIKDAGPFYFAESDHQQYCFKNPEGYCHHGGTGVALPAL